jgi:hypothetical protein
MNNCKKTIKLSDISITPIKLKYSASYGSSNFNDYNILAQKGTKVNMSITGSLKRSDLNFKSIENLYYKNYLTGSLLNSASLWDWNQQSTVCSGSSNYENRFFPTQSNSVIGIIAIPPQTFGDQISTNTFMLSPEYSSNYRIVDDGNGNLIDKVNNNVHVGNVIYSHGNIIITNPNYSQIFSQTQLAIFIVNRGSSIRVNSIGLNSGGISYTGGTFPINSSNSTIIYPNTYNITDIQATFYVSSNGSNCVRSKHLKRDQFGNVLYTYTDTSTITIPGIYGGSAPVTFATEVNYLGEIDQYSYLELSITPGTCT